MCGIVGYIGKQEAFPILIKGLKRLEYRGYDSAGVALQHASGDIVVCKTKGKVINLESCAQGKDLSGSLGIAHVGPRMGSLRSGMLIPTTQRAEKSLLCIMAL